MTARAGTLPHARPCPRWTAAACRWRGCSYRRVRCVARGGPISTPSTPARTRWAPPSRRCLTVAAGAATLFVLLAVAVVVSAHTFAVDLSLHAWLLEHRTPGLTSAASAVTATGASGLLVPVVFLAALVLGRGPRRARLAQALAVTAVLLVGIALRLAIV